MKKNVIFQVTLHVPPQLTDDDIKAFLESAVKSEPGFYMPNEPQSEIELLGVQNALTGA